jgi:hypothetical protein
MDSRLPIEFDQLAGMAARIAAHPKFDDAVLHYAQSLLEWKAANRNVGKAQASHARSSIIGYILFLHFAADPADPDDGATYQKLWALCERRRDCGPRVLKTALALFRFARFVTQENGQRDRRLRLYRPTANLVEFVTDWYARSLGAFDQLNDTNRFAARMRGEPLFLREVILATGYPYLQQDIKLVQHFPQLYQLFMIDGGFPVVTLLAKTRLTGESLPQPSAIGAAFGISTSQVRNVLKSIETQGLLQPDSPGGPPGLLALYRAYVAREMALFAQYALPEGVLD